MKKWAPATPTHHHDCLRQNIDTDMSEKGEWKEKAAAVQEQALSHLKLISL